MSKTALNIAQMIDLLSESDQALLYDIVSRMMKKDNNEDIILADYEDMINNPNKYKTYSTAEEMMEDIFKDA